MLKEIIIATLASLTTPAFCETIEHEIVGADATTLYEAITVREIPSASTYGLQKIVDFSSVFTLICDRTRTGDKCAFIYLDADAANLEDGADFVEVRGAAAHAVIKGPRAIAFFNSLAESTETGGRNPEPAPERLIELQSAIIRCTLDVFNTDGRNNSWCDVRSVE